MRKLHLLIRERNTVGGGGVLVVVVCSTIDIDRKEEPKIGHDISVIFCSLYFSVPSLVCECECVDGQVSAGKIHTQRGSFSRLLRAYCLEKRELRVKQMR